MLSVIYHTWELHRSTSGHGQHHGPSPSIENVRNIINIRNVRSIQSKKHGNRRRRNKE
jgi:hypothetical protein